ncbi:hypothetical protein ABFS82_12G066200 [Erythranthe guttata]|uniref:DUF7054 domain-containing protein n=1 Tax=Erythranthe guttata TaxID=4155 RepID=A0A022QZN9_ERYGU|nr:PREDICTED: uncharacterized protein At4g22758-like [Erythranthe guttata]EYU33134.1 hypothetical protein MIMGU_mgv1a016072mg [Erythranthe guttata]|eukprot:XP_012842555.1 PREDICTED: uncharacterized protein At4g22758-like [Erythranthe guttata]
MFIRKQKKNLPSKGKRFLISITVLGSAGPIRFVVNEDDLVGAVMDTAMKSYARQGRLPVLGSDLNAFMLYSPFAGTQALLPCEKIGSAGIRDFILCKKPQIEMAITDDNNKASPKGSGSLRAFFNKSLHVKISFH